MSTPEERKEADRRRITVHKTMTALRAIIFADKVPDVICEERAATCFTCDQRRVDKHRVPFCGLCGCTVHEDKTAIINLCRYVEKLPDWGCKHPLRDKGLGGWRR